MKQKIIYCDGSTSFNNVKDLSRRKMVICYVDVQIPNHFQIRPSHLKNGSNNIAEILGILEALRYAYFMHYKDLLIKTDSRIAHGWVTKGLSKKGVLNNRKLTEYILARINKIKPWFNKLKFEVINRKENLAGHVLEKRVLGRKIQ